MAKVQKRWETPQLIVLAKAEPEENVLTSCKTMNPNQPQTGPADFILQDTCAQGDDTNCSNCLARGLNLS